MRIRTAAVWSVVFVFGMFALVIAGGAVGDHYLEQGRAIPLYARIFLGWAGFVRSFLWLLVPLIPSILITIAIFTPDARPRTQVRR
jgi:type II secretory pathway component PulF